MMVCDRIDQEIRAVPVGGDQTADFGVVHPLQDIRFHLDIRPAVRIGGGHHLPAGLRIAAFQDQDPEIMEEGAQEEITGIHLVEIVPRFGHVFANIGGGRGM